MIANCKLAAFWDFLFFDPNIDSVMNIEPVILSITNSVFNPRGNQEAGRCYLDFLARLIENFHPPSSEDIRSNCIRALLFAKDCGVIQNLSGTMFNERFPQSLRHFLADTFEPIFSLENPKEKVEPIIEIENNNCSVSFNNGAHEDSTSFSEDEDSDSDPELEIQEKLNNNNNGTIESSLYKEIENLEEQLDIFNDLEQLSRSDKFEPASFKEVVSGLLDHFSCFNEESQIKAAQLLVRVFQLQPFNLGEENNVPCMDTSVTTEPVFMFLTELQSSNSISR